MDPVGDGLVASGLWWRSELRAAGVSDDELRRLRRSGAVARVRPGAYLVADAEELRAAEESVVRHRLAVHAAVPRLAPGTVVSHVSAAVVHGLPLEPALIPRRPCEDAPAGAGTAPGPGGALSLPR
jgi:hypothetical protein